MDERVIKIDFQLGMRPYSVIIDPDEKRILYINFEGYDSRTARYPDGPFSDDAKQIAELLFEDWKKRNSRLANGEQKP